MKSWLIAASGHLRRNIGRRWLPTAVSLFISGGLIFAGRPSSAQETTQAVSEATAVRYLDEGQHAEAEAVAEAIVQSDPESRVGWELLGASRYLQDNGYGALRAWGHIGKPQVRQIDIDLLPLGNGTSGPGGGDRSGLIGIRSGDLLTVDRLIQGERRLRAIPAATQARLEYRMQTGGDADLSGVVSLDEIHPFTRRAVAAHSVRLLLGRLHLRSANPLGQLEAWELIGRMSADRYSIGLSLAHPAPFGQGVWRWTADHAEGSRATTAEPSGVREERTGIEWRHSDWLAARVRGSILGRVDDRLEGGTVPGAGMVLTFLPLDERSAITLSGTFWSGLGESDGFGRLSLLASHYPQIRTSPGGPSGVAAALGVVAISAGAPTDLTPLFGAGGHADILMRAHRELDSDGLALALLPGTAWIHGGIELLHSLGALGPVGIGVALFADGAGVISENRVANSVRGRRAALNLGAGGRARVTGVPGWLRIDWGVNPEDGASTVSAGWVLGAPS